MLVKARLIVPGLLIGLSMLGFAGCAEDNDATATAGVKSTTGDTPPPKNQAEYGQRQAGTGTTKKGQYPGAK